MSDLDARALCSMIAGLKGSGKSLKIPIGLGYGKIYWDDGRFVLDHGFCEIQFQEPVAMDDTYLYLGLGMDRACIDCRAMESTKVKEVAI